MIYHLEASFTYHRTAATDLALGEFLDRVDEHLVEKLGAEDVFIVSEDSTSSFTISMTVEPMGAEPIEATMTRGMTTMRTAFHAEDCGTQDWPDCFEFEGATWSKVTRVADRREPALV